jgi:NAD(P)-dependent dehydrogenase (short-subunit alcohol dehydrogenase family)
MTGPHSPEVEGGATTPVAVVTGGGSGIGRATVLQLLTDGFRVVAADLNPAALDETLALTGTAERRGRVVAVPADVSREQDVAAAVEAAVDTFDALTCMVNNAGVGGAFGAITEIDVEDWDYTFAVLTRGVFLGVKHAARAMQAGRWPGSIVNVSSVAGMTGGIAAQAYSAAKAAVLSLTQTTSIELAPQRIRVNAVCPGVIGTPLVHRGRPERYADTLQRVQPWPDGGRAEDIADAICFLAGRTSAFVTGQSLVVDGGLLAAGPGAEFEALMKIDPSSQGLVGVNRGNTGQASEVRSRRGTS